MNDVPINDPKGKLYNAMIGLGTKRMSKAKLAGLLKKLSKPGK